MVADFIPSEFREFVYAENLIPQEIENIKFSSSIVEYVDGEEVERRYTDEEIIERFRRIRGVIDTRDGSYHPNKYFKD